MARRRTDAPGEHLRPIGDAVFDAFVDARLPALKRIVRHTRREYQLGDVRNEAWELAALLTVDRNGDFDLRRDDMRELLIGRLYQKLVRHDDTRVRYALRLDQGLDDASEHEPHPLLAKLSAPESSDPLLALMAMQEELDHEAVLERDGSATAAYVRLLRRFDNRMPDVADYLLISLSHCYRCQRKVLARARGQESISGIRSHQPLEEAKPWRRYRLQREWRQLQLFAASTSLWHDEACTHADARPGPESVLQSCTANGAR